MRAALFATLLALAPGCSVEDADVAATAALTGITVTASTDLLASRQSRVTGAVTLGYTSSELVQIRIIDNSVEVFAASVPAAALTIPVDAVVDLVDPGANELTIEVGYFGQQVRERILVTVPAALQGLAATPAATARSVFSVDVSGGIDFGYLAAEPARLSIAVNGGLVHAEDVAAPATLAATFLATIPLDRQGSNAVVVTVSYEGEALTRAFSVDVDMDAPDLTFPTWIPTYLARDSMIVTGDVDIATNAAYTIDSVLVSVDGGEWLPPGTTGTAGTYAVTITNPDIGDSSVAVAVVTSQDGHAQTTTFHDVLHIDPVFDCTTPATSMLPDNDFNRGRTEVRTMIGYFGDPTGGHDIAFVLSATVPGEGLYQSVAKVIARGFVAMSVEYNVDQLDCQNPPCTLAYDLAFLVDGVTVCSQTSFGFVARN